MAERSRELFHFNLEPLGLVLAINSLIVPAKRPPIHAGGSVDVPERNSFIGRD